MVYFFWLHRFYLLHASHRSLATEQYQKEIYIIGS